MDPIDIYDFVSNNWSCPLEHPSDLAIIGSFAREHNISFNELKKEFIKFLSVSKTLYENTNFWIKKLEESNRMLNPEGFLLDSTLSSSPNREYKVIVHYDKDNKLLVKIYQILKDDDIGTFTGVPYSTYFNLTPGQYYATTLLGTGRYGSYGHENSNVLCIDGGSNWNLYGMIKVKEEILKKFKEELKKELESER